jgi:quinol monooxygenase YgiN
MSNPWMSHEDNDETDGAANPWLADDGASETDEIDSSQLNNGGLGRAVGGGGVDSGAGDNGNGNVDNNDNFSDFSDDAPLDPEDDEELRALHERDFGSAGPAAAAAAALAPFVSLYPPDLALTILTKFEVDPSKMEIFGRGLDEAAKRTRDEPGYLNSLNFQRCELSAGSDGDPSDPIAGSPGGCVQSEQYHDEDDRKPAAVNLSDTHAAKLEAPVLMSAISQSKDSKDGSNTSRKRGRDANLSFHEAKHESTRKEEQDDHKRMKTDPKAEKEEITTGPELPMKHPNAHNVLNYGKVTRMDLLHAAGNNSYNATFFSSMLMNGALKSFMLLSMWHQCNHSVEHELRRKGQIGSFVMWRTRYLDVEDHSHKHCVIKSLCQIANYFQPEEVNMNECVSYEILVSNDVDRGNEIVELGSWVNKNAYLYQQAIFHSSPELQESRTVVDLFCDLSKQEETFWVSNPL